MTDRIRHFVHDLLAAFEVLHDIQISAPWINPRSH